MCWAGNVAGVTEASADRWHGNRHYERRERDKIQVHREEIDVVIGVKLQQS